MSNILYSTWEASVLAALPQGTYRPAEPVYYGTDLSCIEDLDSMCSEVDATSPSAVGQNILRRLSTPRGKYIHDPAAGLFVPGYLNHGAAPEDLRSLERQIQSECLKDERVTSADVTCTIGSGDRRIEVGIKLTLAAASTAFSLVFAVDGSGRLVGVVDGSAV